MELRIRLDPATRKSTRSQSVLVDFIAVLVLTNRLPSWCWPGGLTLPAVLAP